MNAPLPTFSGRPLAKRIRVYLMHSCPIVCAGLGAMLAGQPGMDVSAPGRWPCADEPCVVIADYAAALRAAREGGGAQHERAVRLLVVTQNGKAGEVRHAVDSGVHGYLLQEADAGELVECVRLLASGCRYLGAAAGRSVANALGRPPLTRREADVLSVLSHGLPDKLIARELGIGVGTVKTHMKQLMHKFDVSTRTQVVLSAMEQGLLAGLQPQPQPMPRALFQSTSVITLSKPSRAILA
jgi:DNA-binding NarL/FixJ family response regulator